MPKTFFRGTFIFASLVLSACANVKTAPNGPDNLAAGTAPSGATPGAPATEGADKAKPVEEKEVSSETVEINAEKPYKSSYGEISLDDNDHVQVWVRYFQGKGRKYMEQYLARSTKYLPMMKNTLRENGLPEDLVYIALIESGFSPIAHSRSNAVGYWQFIRATGRRFGLTVDPFIDERRDPVLSTRAAAEYFKSLYSLFGSWHLALSAYNVGENRVKNAVTRYYTRDFWELIRKRRSLPAETKQYVPKFIAATLIAKNPEKYGFSNIEYSDPLSYDSVALTSPISLSKLASNIGVDTEELRLLNPKFRSDYVPISRGSETFVRLPVGRANDAAAALSLSVSAQPKVVANSDIVYYRIRRGDSLSTIAHRHRTTVSRLRRLNNLSNRTLLRVGMRLRINDSGGESVTSVVEEDAAPSANTAQHVAANDDLSSETVDFHIVRRGENLSTIAQHYGVSIGELKRLNNLSSRALIRKGQKLKIRPESSPKSAHARKTPTVLAKFQNQGRVKTVQNEMGKSRRIAGQGRRHVVRRGETLYDVSKKYGVALNRLAKANGLAVNYRVMAGERLFIPQ